MKIIQLNNIDKYLPIITKHQNSVIPVLIIGITDRLVIYDTNKNDINYDILEQLNIDILPFHSNGGAAVSSPNDLGFHFIIPGRQSGWCRYIFNSIQSWLASQGISAHIVNNDLTIQGKKVAGYTESVNGNTNNSIFIAMTNSQTIISQVCLKSKVRFTAGLNDYGITNQEIINIVSKATDDYIKFMNR